MSDPALTDPQPEPRTGKHGVRGERARWLIAGILLALWLAGTCLRVTHFRAIEYYSPDDDRGLFWTENAFHYRYAKMVAEGRPLPTVDEKVQHPDGLDLSRNITIFMERVDAILYRLLAPGMPFHVFLVIAICATATAGLFPAYGVARAIWGRPAAGLTAAAFYTVCIAAYARIVGSYVREHMSMPLLFFALWPFVAALASPSASPRRRRCLALLAGSLLALALASWHLSRFYFLVLMACTAVVWAYQSWRDDADAPRLAGLTAWMLIPVVIGGLLTPLLRDRLFYLYPLAFGLIFRLAAGKRMAEFPRVKRMAIPLALFVVVGGVITLCQPGEGGYSHVWALLAAKFRFAGIKPADPARVGFEARLMWIEAFHTPDLRTFLYTYGTLPWLALGGVLLNAKRIRKAGAGVLLTLMLACAFLLLYLLIQRMTGFFAFFLIVLTAGLAVRNGRVLVVIAMCFCVDAHSSLFFRQATPIKKLADRVAPQTAAKVPNWAINNRKLLDWISRHTGPDDGFLTRFGTGPLVLAYADRPIVLQSKVENVAVRERIREYVAAVYGAEQELYDYCRKYQARYFLYEAQSVLNASPDSDRYLADALELRRDCAAYLCHFQPERLEHFRLVFQNSFFRLFEVNDGPSAEAPLKRYEPIYDIKLYGEQSSEFFDDRQTDLVLARVSLAVLRFTDGQGLLAAGRIPEAIRSLHTAVKLNPGLLGGHTTLGIALMRGGLAAEALLHLEREVTQQPELVEGYYNLGFLLANLGRVEEARATWLEGLALDPHHPAIQDGLSQLNNR